MDNILDLSEQLARKAAISSQISGLMAGIDPEVNATGVVQTLQLKPEVLAARKKLIDKLINHYENAKNDALIAIEKLMKDINTAIENNQQINIIDLWNLHMNLNTKNLEVDFNELFEMKTPSVPVPQCSAIGKVIKKNDLP